ncbi:tRNA lysidine(34) synthetase TilS [Bifidobacterium asteroides]|uniref:tRNA(Ile)-lysidine synthase n=1 Tax=Bifidobacterium asteroides TaxID=1684 RepID=A0A318MW90_9BIFI|nr:tRNA lysidine(34) synthetase TilS [Bifidobacterium asteroides]PXY88271.1 tRNA lysidine(34) synthetase TilS [Bifidobacterium asteroides]
MVYSAEMKRAVGLLRSTLGREGLGLQDKRFAHHGVHRPDSDAPLILVACSGGRDSLALACVAHLVADMTGLRCGALLIDHGLVPNSDRIAAHAAGTCRALGLDPVLVTRVDVPVTSAGPEADARAARYQALSGQALRLGARAVLLAHTRDDQAETVMIGLIRSQGLEAITGMARHIERGGMRYLRPFLDLDRKDTTAICRQQRIDWWDDPTNGDDQPADCTLPETLPLRSRIRHDLLPALDRFAGRDMVRRLALGADMARLDQDYLDSQVNGLYQRLVVSPNSGQKAKGVLACLDARGLADCHPALRTRLLAQVLTKLGIRFTAVQVRALDDLVCRWHGQQGPRFPSSHTAIRKGQVILICNDGDHAHR